MDHIICHFEIPADDVEKLASFYTEMFGWKITPMGAEFGGYYGIETVPGKMDALMGGMMARQSPQHTHVNYVLVEDVNASVAQAKALGATVVMDKSQVPGMGWFALLVDPQKNPIGIFEEMKK